MLATSCSGPTEPVDQRARQAPEAAESQPSSATARQSQLLLDGRGLIFSDSAGARRTLAFGGGAPSAIDAARQVYGDPEKVETLEECGAGPLQVSKFAGLTLAAQDGKFVGWWLDGGDKAPLPTTERGIGIGSAREALDAAYSIDEFESSLGQEFTADGLAGLIEGEGKLGKVTHLWAGATCIMR